MGFCGNSADDMLIIIRMIIDLPLCIEISLVGLIRLLMFHLFVDSICMYIYICINTIENNQTFVAAVTAG